MRLPSIDTLIRISVVLVLAGLLLLLPILFEISALNVGLYMLASLLLGAGIVLYVLAVVRDLKRKQAI